MLIELPERMQSFFSGNQRSVAVKKNMVFSILVRFISIAVSFLLVPITIGYVSAELYGVWLTLSSIMTWVSFMDIGFTQGLKNRLAEAIALGDWNRGKQLVSTTYWMMIVIFVPLCIILLLFLPLIDWCDFLNVNRIYESEVINVISIVISFACLQMIVNVLVAVVAAFQKVALSNSFLVIGNILSLFVIIILTKTVPPSLVNLAVTFCSAPVIVTILASFILFKGKFNKVSPSLHCLNKNLVNTLFGLGYKFFIINIQVLVLYQSTNVLISNVSSPLMVTSYNLAYKYLGVAMMIFTIITAPLWPAYTDAFVKKDYLWMRNIRKKMERILILVILGIIVLIILSSFVYRLWLDGKAYIPFSMTLLVGIYCCAFCWMNLNTTFLAGIGKIRLHTYVAVGGMIIHIPLSLFLASSFGAYGVVLSMIIVNFVYASIYNKQVYMILNRKSYGIWNQ